MQKITSYFIYCDGKLYKSLYEIEQERVELYKNARKDDQAFIKKQWDMINDLMALVPPKENELKPEPEDFASKNRFARTANNKFFKLTGEYVDYTTWECTHEDIKLRMYRADGSMTTREGHSTNFWFVEYFTRPSKFVKAFQEFYPGAVMD